MIRKLFFIVLSLVIVVTGAFAFRKLKYWERSAAIFDYREMDRRFEGRGGRGGSGFDGRSREAYDRRGGRGTDRDFVERPEGEMRERPEREFGERPERESRERPEGEMRERPEREFQERSDGRSSFGPGDRGRGGHGRGDFRRGKAVRLRNVAWFLAVFSAFTAVSVYLDRVWLHLRKKRQRSGRNRTNFL